MPTRCAVPTCNNNNYKSHEVVNKFYSFPRDSNRIPRNDIKLWIVQESTHTFVKLIINKQKLWVQMIGRLDINVEKDISKNYSICDIHFHPLMIANGRLKEYALPVILVSPESSISLKHSVETQTCFTCHLVNECYTQTESVQLTDKNVQTNSIESFETANNSGNKKDEKSQTSSTLSFKSPRKQKVKRQKLRDARTRSTQN